MPTREKWILSPRLTPPAMDLAKPVKATLDGVSRWARSMFARPGVAAMPSGDTPPTTKGSFGEENRERKNPISSSSFAA